MRTAVLLLLGSTTAIGQSPSSSSLAVGLGAETTIIEHGRRDTRMLLNGQPESLSTRMTATMLAAVGGPDGFATRLAQLHGRAGAEVAVISETAFESPAGTEYYRVSRFTGIRDTTLELHWAWTPLDSIAGVTVSAPVQPAPSAYLAVEPKTKLRLPFGNTSGASWYVAWGGRTPQQNYHAIARDQRFAYDFMLVRDGKLSTGDGKDNAQFACFGTPVVAPAAGTIVQARDSVEDNVPGQRNRASPPGNYVVIDHGDSEFSLIAHFRRGSVRVRRGDKVTVGQVVGECGNSGQSTMPHVHFHLQTGNDYQVGDGLPPFFSGYISNGKAVTRGEPARGEYLRTDP